MTPAPPQCRSPGTKPLRPPTAKLFFLRLVLCTAQTMGVNAAVAAQTAADPEARAAPAAHAAQAQTPPTLAQRLTLLLNAYRRQQGLESLQRDAGLDAIAAGHSRWMAQHRLLSHQGFQRRFDSTQAPLCVENLGAGRPSPAQAQHLLDAWIASPRHHINLLEPRTRHVGVAEVDGYVTVFACDRPTIEGTALRP